MTSVTLYEVGGCVRDELLGVPSKDIDFAVEADSLDTMRDWLEAEGFEIFLDTPEFFTIRARFPKREWTFGGRQMAVTTCDFVLCRKEGAYTDGRRPDEVKMGTIRDDLARRDFTVNAIARRANGTLLDPFGGEDDLAAGTLRAVGRAEDRLREDSLRALRALRFQVTKGLTCDEELVDALCSAWLPELLAAVSTERKREELRKAFRFNTLKTFEIIAYLPRTFREAIFTDGLWLDPSLKG